PYGVESMGVLRLEKGHFVLGRDADGRTTPHDIGLGRMVSTKKWFVGREALDLPAMKDPRRRQLVGVKPVNSKESVPYSAMLADPDDPDRVGGAQGWISSLAYSPTLGHFIGLALVEGGFGRMGERLLAHAPIAGRRALVEIVSPHFFDPEGKRQNA
ncbi:MAG TPA: glycine cleavage T C-terminal barrel domain-containing protein, partial [Paracoccaceae bacterium]|nr:glycine cleavage T C-terminal barrel domain-containing protein [Paracoccaceae bacterium]